MFHVRGSASTKTGEAPVYAIGFTDPTNVKSEQNTSSPRCTPSTRRPMWIAAVPVTHAIACLAPTRAAKASSKRPTKGPTEETKPDSTTSMT